MRSPNLLPNLQAIPPDWEPNRPIDIRSTLPRRWEKHPVEDCYCNTYFYDVTHKRELQKCQVRLFPPSLPLIPPLLLALLLASFLVPDDQREQSPNHWRVADRILSLLRLRVRLPLPHHFHPLRLQIRLQITQS
jgi:hypothetical protein